MSYYNLSAEESDDDSESEEEEQGTAPTTQSSVATDDAAHKLWDRVILHLDVDCFYCQCEQVDGPPEYSERPLAIGQKHIIVTSNYIARQHGVQKLQSRDAAYRACPNLLIIEGSDLKRYRQHSRKIYLAFRNTLQTMARQVPKASVTVRKGGMDECFADITELVQAQSLLSDDDEATAATSVFCYGDDPNYVSKLVEDQSGAQVEVRYSANGAGTNNDERTSVHLGHSSQARLACQMRVDRAAASICQKVHQLVYQQTGFTTSLGISVSKLLAKLASDLKKPKSINVLYPWRSHQLLLPMPLRKIPNLGRSTLKLLSEGCLEPHLGTTKNTNDGHEFWTCRDLLQVPVHSVQEACLGDADKARELLGKCRGLDLEPVLDDKGGLTQQVSVEDSFRRGTVQTKQAVLDALETLLIRLPLLLEDRQEASNVPSLAYPTTLRLTARLVDPQLIMASASKPRRRPYVTQSRQTTFHGKRYLQEHNNDIRKNLLRDCVMPLVKSLIFERLGGINLTRMNLAVTNFQDYLSPQERTSSIVRFAVSTPTKSNRKRPATAVIGGTTRTAIAGVADRTKNYLLDPSILAELPPDIVAELLTTQQQRPQQLRTMKAKKLTMQSFFAPKK